MILTLTNQSELGPGVKYSGRCPACDGMVGGREVLDAALYRSPQSKLMAVHASCCGAVVKSKIGGGRFWRTPPRRMLDLGRE
ncbi:MAG: hypothetical protein ACRD2F_11025 [Terriglobales bacterium]